MGKQKIKAIDLTTANVFTQKVFLCLDILDNYPFWLVKTREVVARWTDKNGKISRDARDCAASSLVDLMAKRYPRAHENVDWSAIAAERVDGVISDIRADARRGY